MSFTSSGPHIEFSKRDAPDPATIATCVHCGLCLNECPTYRVLRLEMDSPRGRIQLTKAVSEGQMSLASPTFLKHTFRCLDCRACETACPSGVKYGQIIEDVRAQTVQAGLLPMPRRIADFVLRYIFTRPRALRMAGIALRMYQQSGLQWLLRNSRILKVLAPSLARLDDMAPAMSGQFLQASDLSFIPAEGEQRHRVAFLTGCIMPLSFADAHRASIRVLSRAGCDVHLPEHQQCCGALHVHGGAREAARDLARQNIDAFQAVNPEAIVVNSAGCASALKEYGELLDGDPIYGPLAHAFAGKIRDFSEFLVEIGGGSEPSHLDRDVVYQDACHLVHAQGISQQPRDLIGAIPGVNLVDIANPTICCGAAGLYSVTDTEVSLQILDEKLDAIQATGASTVVSGNPGCILHLRTGARRRGLDLQVMHIAELLDSAHSED